MAFRIISIGRSQVALGLNKALGRPKRTPAVLRTTPAAQRQIYTIRRLSQARTKGSLDCRHLSLRPEK